MANTIFGANQDDVLNGLPRVENYISGENGNDKITGWFLTDSLYGGNGEDIIYGDRGDATNPINIPDAISRILPSIIVSPPQVILGSDYISGGAGNDFLVGDNGTTITLIKFAQSITSAGNTASSFFQIKRIRQKWGDDYIIGDNGDDIVFGDTVGPDIESEMNGSNASADGEDAIAITTVSIDNNLFTFGSNTIDGGNGNDILIGSARVNDNEPGAGKAVAENGGSATTIFNHDYNVTEWQKNIIYGGNGDDKIYGTGDINSHVIAGGDAEAHSGGVALAEEIISNSVVSFGNDILYGDAGNDEIYGDVWLYYNSISGGSAIADGPGSQATSVICIDNTKIKFGNDQIDGGAGDDQLFGDALQSTLEIESNGTEYATNGGMAETIAKIVDFHQIMGDDIISGGDGNNIFIGDAVIYSLIEEAFTSEVIIINATSYLRIADQFNNSITWGNDCMTGGKSKDDYIFSLFTTKDGEVGTQGFDVITNFEMGRDSLSFGGMVDKNNDGAVDVKDLALTATLSQVNGDTILSFMGGGSITLLSTSILSFSDLNLLVSGSPVGFTPLV